MRARRRWTLLLAAVCLVALAGCGGDEQAELIQAAPGDAGPGDAEAAPAPPEGFRWESYRDAMVAVPASWRWGGSGRISQWCAAGVEGSTRATDPPVVGRPGPTTSVGCPDGKPGKPSPGSLLRNGGTYVAFTGARPAGLVDEGDRVVVSTAHAAVVIQAPAELRAQIAATVRNIEIVDHNGCALTHALTSDPAWRPAPTDLATVDDVTSIAACKYDFADATGEDRPAASGPLLASSQRLTGEEARSALAALVAAPTPGGPDDPSSCSPSYAYGDEAILLRLARASGVVLVVMRYSSCDHNGFDDGVTVRRLTPAAGHPFVDQANFVSSYSGTAEKTAVLHPESAAAAREKERATR